MKSYYQHLPSIDNKLYTDYFIDKFIPKYKFIQKLVGIYTQYHRDVVSKEIELLKLELTLIKKYKFPKIEYISIFEHTQDQPIHSDGIDVPRYASLNLPISGWEGTKMNFYDVRNRDLIPNIRDANYYDENDVTYAVELNGENSWVLVDSSTPHHIIQINSANPRMTVCVRFMGNPTFNELLDRING